MTTIILVGGNKRETSDNFGKRLACEVSMRIERPRILSCQFAKSDMAERRNSEQSWTEWFNKFLPGADIIIAKPEIFYDQAKVADVIYLHGGHTKTLMQALPDFEQSRQVFSGKIVIGSSAGANYLASAGYSPKGKEYFKGIGLAGVGVLVHYGAAQFLRTDEWREIANELAQRCDTEVVCLSEGEFVVLEKL